jgi:uncharacterized membrane protein
MSTTTDQSTAEGGVSTEATSSGLEENVAAALSYALGWLTGIVMFVVEPDNDTVRFHAAQSIVVFGAISVASIAISFIQSALLATLSVGPGTNVVFGLFSMFFGLVSLLIWVGAFVLWLYLLVRTYQEDDPRIPVAAGIADDLV